MNSESHPLSRHPTCSERWTSYALGEASHGSPPHKDSCPSPFKLSEGSPAPDPPPLDLAPGRWENMFMMIDSNAEVMMM